MAKGEKPVVDYSSCVACGICIEACPFSCLDLTHFEENALYNNALPELVHDNLCTGCGLCMKACPIDIINLK